MKESHTSYMQNMEDVSNDDGMNSDLDDHEYEEDDDEFVHSSFNRSKTSLDDDLLFNNNNGDTNLLNGHEINSNASKRKRMNSLKYCKKRKCRTTFTKSQLNTLENEFLKSNFVSNDRIDLLIEMTSLDSRIIKNWFKNKRSRVLADSKANNVCAKAIGSDSHSLSSSSPFSIRIEKPTTDPNTNQMTPLSTTDLNSYSPSSISNASTINQLFVQTSNFAKDNSNPKLPYLISKTISNLNSEALTTEPDNYHFNSSHSSPMNVQEHSNHETKSNGLLNIFSISNQENEVDKALIKSNNPMPVSQPNAKKIFKVNEIIRKQNLKKLVDMKDSNCLVCSRFSKLFCICNVSNAALNRLYRNYTGFNGIFQQNDNLKKNQSEKYQQFVNNENEIKVFEIL